MARYEKKYGTQDFHINRYTKKDYIRLESMKMSIALTVAFFIILAIICLMRLDMVLSMLRGGKIFLPFWGMLIIYVVIFLVYLYFTKKRATKVYDEMEKRIKIYDKYLEDLIRFNETKEQEDIRPTINPEEEEDGTTINI